MSFPHSPALARSCDRPRVGGGGVARWPGQALRRVAPTGPPLTRPQSGPRAPLEAKAPPRPEHHERPLRGPERRSEALARSKGNGKAAGGHAMQSTTRDAERVTEGPRERFARLPYQNHRGALSGAKIGLSARNTKNATGNIENENGRLTMMRKSRSVHTSDMGDLSGSVAKKATPGFSPRQSQGVRNRAPIVARFFLSWSLVGRAYGFGRMGPRKRATPCGGCENSVRPARHFLTWRVGFNKQDHKETCYV
jgi:hypothetical protein